jgi:hypothetical protein
MFNNVALDIFIGLMFIFLMYSLLATAINEFIATLFAYRHRMLEKAIEQMMDGKSYSYYWWDKLINIFSWIFSDKKKIVGEGTNDAKPLIKHFISNEKTYKNNEPEVLKFSVGRVKLDKKAKLFAAKIVNHPLYRRKAEHSILFKKPAYLKSETFSDILMDILTDRKSSLNGSPILMNDIKEFVSKNLEDNPDLKRILNLYIEQANGDVQKFKLLLENWFDDTMERVSGWYKRQSNKILLVIGFFLALAFNVSSIVIASKLSKDKKVREALVQNASDYVRTHYVNDTAKIVLKEIPPQSRVSTPAPPTGSSKKNSSDSLSNKKDSSDQNADTNLNINTTTHDDSLQQRAKQQLQEIKDLYEKSIEENNNLLGLGWGDYGYTNDTIKYKISQGINNYALYRDSIEINVKDTNDFKQRHKIQNFKEYKEQVLENVPSHPKKRGAWGKLLFILGQSFSNSKLLLGFLITAFAISLGAPFWFDLLNKFVNLRVSGVKPDSDRANTSKTVLLNTKPDSDSVG